MVALIRQALEVVPKERLWINPDCGLKTRQWPETFASLRNMMTAARLVRSELEYIEDYLHSTREQQDNPNV